MTKIKLSNSLDLSNAAEGRLAPEAVRSIEIEALADTGAIELCIPQEVADFLGVPITRHRSVRVADGRRLDVSVVGRLDIEVLGRGMDGDAIVLPAGTPALLGAVVLELLDLVVVPRTGEVIPNPAHPDGAVIPVLLAG